MSSKSLFNVFLRLGLVVALFGALSLVGHAQTRRHVPGQILVKTKAELNDSSVTELLKSHGAVQKGLINGINVRVVNVPEDKLDHVLEALSHNPNIEFAEPDYVASADFVPNDPYYTGGNQWHHAKIQSPQAWDITQGTTNIVVAVLDTGVDASHPDLAGKVLAGYNYIANTSNFTDDHGHGTAVAGTAAATGNNGVGVAGVAIKNCILPVKVLDSTGNGSYSAIANGITFAANKGARIINLSVAGSSSSSTLQSAVDYAWNKNSVIVAAAGNNANNTPQYPAACNHAVAVSATDSSDNLASFSSYGSYVTVSAPGQGIVTTTKGGSYSSWSGTSFASPVAAGVAALVASANPQLSNAQIVDALKTSTDDLGSAGYDMYFGYGRVNASKAVAAVVPAPAPVYDVTAPTTAVNSPVANTTVSGTVAVNVSAADNVGVTKVECYLDGVLLGSAAAASANFNWDTTQHVDGPATIQSRAFDAAGNIGTSQTVTVNVNNVIVTAPDTTAPSVQIVSPQNGAVIATKNAKVQVISQDNVGVTRVELYVDGAYAGASTSANPLFSWNHISRGAHTLQVIAYDAAGNRGVSSVTSVTRN